MKNAEDPSKEKVQKTKKKDSDKRKLKEELKVSQSSDIGILVAKIETKTNSFGSGLFKSGFLNKKKWMHFYVDKIKIKNL